MKIVSFTRSGSASFGLIENGGVIDVGKRLGGAYAGLHELLRKAGGAETHAILRAYAGGAPDCALTQIALDKPLADWGKGFCVGVNYPERNAEYKDGSTAPGYPSLFVRFPSSFTGPDRPLIRPPESVELDYEGEIVMVIGKAGRRVSPERWTEHVFGWTLANEGTIRDWVRHGKFNVTPGKNWPESGALGPWIIPFEEAGPGPFDLVTRVNGEERQRDTTSRMTFSFARIVEYISTFTALEPGDIILTGTPAGAGARRDPPIWLKAGDRIEVEAPGIGLLANGVRDE
ncbi:MAG TPA: fumarylacetoacetate hydrolase family protein [Roseiarcus sp.]|nr:fumarylacetoacetate hydrolase family protein [Roseiarcus sp.]